MSGIVLVVWLSLITDISRQLTLVMCAPRVRGRCSNRTPNSVQYQTSAFVGLRLDF